MKQFFNAIRPSLRVLHLMVLLFPVAVTTLVALIFLCGGKCASYQWYLGIFLAVIFAMIISKESLKDKLKGIGWFLLFLFGFYIFANITASLANSYDPIVYHLPAIRLMIDGWNPVWQCTPNGIEAATGVSAETMRYFHVISMPKGMWFFNAASYYFTHQPFSLTLTLVPFIFFSMVVSLCRCFACKNKYIGIFSVILGLLLLPDYSWLGPLDATVYMATVGLLVSLYDCFKRKRWHTLEIVIFSFWMSVAKQVSLLHLVLYFCIFITTSYIVYKVIEWRKIFMIAGVVFALFLISSISPYVTSYLNFGHPLYPRYTGNEKLYPSRDITEDFLWRNQDAKDMGHLGMFTYTYISPKMALKYYRKMTHRDDFWPHCDIWPINGGHEAIHPYMRWFFCSALLFLLVFGRTSERFIAISSLVCTIAIPTQMLGHIRYVPGFFVLGIFILQPLSYRKSMIFKCCQIAVIGIVANFIMRSVIVNIHDFAVCIDNAYAANMSVKNNPPKIILPYDVTDGGNGEDYAPYNTHANAILLIREIPSLHNSQFIYYPKQSIYAERIAQDPESFPLFYGYNFAVTPDYDLTRYSKHRAITKLKPSERKSKYFKFLLDTIFITLPKSIWKSLVGW